MDHNNSETLRDQSEVTGLTADWDESESSCPEQDQKRCSSCVVTEDLNTNGPWSQRSISRSLQRAEVLLRSTFNPSLRWLFHARSQDDEEEEEHFVVAHNLVSRSSARLLRLQQALLTAAPQWQLVGGAQMGSPQACGKGLPAEGGVVFLPLSSVLQGHYRGLCRLLEQRSLLLFIHEYTRRARLTTAFISRLSQLLEQKLKTPHLTLKTPSSWSSFRVGLSSLSQELRVHLNHWCCLSSKVQSDHCLRPAVVQHPGLLLEMRRTLDLLGLQALVLMERYVYMTLSAVAQTELDFVPREVLEDVLAGTDLYNQAVEEQRVQHSASQLRTAVLQQAHYSTSDPSLPQIQRHRPSAFSVKELMMILAVHHAEMAAKQLHCQVCQVHVNYEAYACSDSSIGPVARLRSESTWEQLQHTYLSSSSLSSIHHPTLQSSSCHTCSRSPPFSIPNIQLDSTILENYCPTLAKPASAQRREEGSKKDKTSQCQTYISQSGLIQTSVEALDSGQLGLHRMRSLENCKLQRTASPPSTTSHHPSALPLSRVGQLDHSSVELLFQVFVSSNELLAPLVSHKPAPEGPPEPPPPATVTHVSNGKTDSTVSCAPVSKNLNQDQNVGGPQQEWAELETAARTDTVSPGFQRDGDPEKEDIVGTGQTAVDPDSVHWPHSVQWLDLGQSLVFADLLGQYRSLLWSLCSRALWLELHVPQAGNAVGSINLQHFQQVQVLQRIGRASETGLLPKECNAMLEDFSLHLSVSTAHAHWDHELCSSLGSALKDKCVTGQDSKALMETSKQDGGLMTSLTMEHFLMVLPPLLSSLSCHHSNSRASGCCIPPPSRWTLRRLTVSLVLASVQLSTLWVVSKAYQFLSSWSLNKFLLIIQGDIRVLREAVEMLVQQTQSLAMTPDNDHYSAVHDHSQLLLRQQLAALDRAVCELQTFSSAVLKTFSTDCKRMSGEIFERTMPSAVHWRPRHRTGFPSSPSEYASLAAQTVIGQVLEGVAPLSDDARVQALSITMTAFMEAWMEHILKQKIKFSVQGALQLKQDFDSIRELIRSDRYGLSADLHQRLLSLRVFQQVDSAVVCLLQQPQAKPYLQSTSWEPFTRCCPAHSSRDSIDAAVTNLRSVEGDDLTQSDPSAVTSGLHPADPSIPAEPYFVPSVALGAAQQEWLDLRIQSGARRWRLPGLQCLYKSEP